MNLEALHHAVPVPYLIEIVAFLLTVVIIVPLFRRFNLSPILGYLAIGALIGPHALKVVNDVTEVQHFAELGVVFLLFTIGLELSFDRLKAYTRLIFGLGAAQVVVCAAAIAAVAQAWGNDLQASIIIGLGLALSSTAMVMQLLSERQERACDHGRVSFAVLLFQDLAVVPILILVSVFAMDSGQSVWLAIAIAMGKALAAVVLIVIVGRVVFRRLFQVASNTRSIDVFTAMMLLTILVTSIATGVAGLSMALGAFLAGLLLAETEFRHQVESEIEPFKGLLLGLFFMGVGMNLDFALAFERGFWVILSVFGLIALKAVITAAIAKLFKISLADSIRSGILLAEAGEFAFVILGQATLTFDIVSPAVGQFIVVVAGLSMLLTPLLASAGKKVSEWLPDDTETSSLLSDEAESLNDHVVISGFGRVGAAVASILHEQSVPYIGIESNVARVEQLRKEGFDVYVGDARRLEMLKRAGLDAARALLVTMNNPSAAEHTVLAAHKHWPELEIIVRSHDLSHAESLLEAGATQVVPETLEASLLLAREVLLSAGRHQDDVQAVIDMIRRSGYSELRS